MVAAVWLVTRDGPLIASASVEVLPDGYVARPLNLDSPEQFSSSIEADLPDVAGRFTGRNHGIELPSTVEVLPPPAQLADWPSGPYSTEILIRLAPGATKVQRVASGLCFTSRSNVLLVGTDASSLAMVLSDDPPTVEQYRSQCDAMSIEDYLASLR